MFSDNFKKEIPISEKKITQIIIKFREAEECKVSTDCTEATPR